MKILSTINVNMGTHGMIELATKMVLEALPEHITVGLDCIHSLTENLCGTEYAVEFGAQSGFLEITVIEN